MRAALLLLVLLAGLATASLAAPGDPTRGDRLLADYFRTETARLADRSMADVKTLEDWTSRRDTYRRQLFEMYGLWPLPPRTDLKAQITGRVDHPQFTVEKLQFQSRPGLYVTGSLYVPKGAAGRVPAILYPCGHGNIKKDGISYGSKSHYQHHGAWFARNGYVCLVIDTLQLGEIEGLHHGTNREGMWWWNSRGYTPGGVEAWNCIRALDYLQSRPEVDPERLGVTGRSGGGAYSWSVAALDERIKAAVPVAGITDLQNHVVDGAVEGHCDCMYHVNTYRWDFAQVAAMVAPRALLISNTDKDRIFPLDGVVRLHSAVRRIYNLHNAGDKLGLVVTEGAHLDTQEIQVPALRWFNRFLKGEQPLLENAAVKLFEPEQLRVFSALPTDQQNTRIHETFVPAAPAPGVPADSAAWRTEREGLLARLRDLSFRGWPEAVGLMSLQPAFAASKSGVSLQAWDFTSQEHVPLRLYVAKPAGLERPELAVLNVLDEQGWQAWLAGMRPGFGAELASEGEGTGDEKAWGETLAMFRANRWAMAYVAPRGIGPTAWSGDARRMLHVQRRFMLLGQTADGMRVWDTRRAIQALRTVPGFRSVPLWLQGERGMSVVALYAALFEPNIARLDLRSLPASHRDGPDFLNVLRVLDIPQAVALAAERSRVKIYGSDAGHWTYPTAVGKKLGWDAKQIEVR